MLKMIDGMMVHPDGTACLDDLCFDDDCPFQGFPEQRTSDCE